MAGIPRTGPQRILSLPPWQAGVKMVAKMVRINVVLSPEEECFQSEINREANKEVRDMVITWEESSAEQRAVGRAEGLALRWHLPRS